MLETMTRGIETSPTDNDRRYLGYAGKYLGHKYHRDNRFR